LKNLLSLLERIPKTGEQIEAGDCVVVFMSAIQIPQGQPTLAVGQSPDERDYIQDFHKTEKMDCHPRRLAAPDF